MIWSSNYSQTLRQEKLSLSLCSAAHNLGWDGLVLTCLCQEWTCPVLVSRSDLSWRVCRRSIWALETDRPPNLVPGWEIFSFCLRGTIASLKLILLLLFSLISFNDVLLRRAARPSKLLALAAISDLFLISGKSLGLSLLFKDSDSLEFSLILG